MGGATVAVYQGWNASAMSSSEDCGMCASGWPLSGDRDAGGWGGGDGRAARAQGDLLGGDLLGGPGVDLAQRRSFGQHPVQTVVELRRQP